jgi:hypothetical protein
MPERIDSSVAGCAFRGSGDYPTNLFTRTPNLAPRT